MNRVQAQLINLTAVRDERLARLSGLKNESPSRSSESDDFINQVNDIGANVNAILLPQSSNSARDELLDSHALTFSFRQQIEDIGVVALRTKYPSEHVAHRRILADAKAGKCEVHAGFRSFKSFLQHVGPKGDPKRSLDRIDNADPEYGPRKVRWATSTEQANNRTVTKFLRGPDGTIHPLAVWARIKGVSLDTLRSRLRRGWPEENVVSGKRPLPAIQGQPPPSATQIVDANPWPDCLPDDWRDLIAEAYVLYRQRLLKGAKQNAFASRNFFTSWALDRICGSEFNLLDQRFPNWRDPCDEHSEGIRTDPSFITHLRLSPIAISARIQLPKAHKPHFFRTAHTAEWNALTAPVRKLLLAALLRYYSSLPSGQSGMSQR
jgi:hypothetical protein